MIGNQSAKLEATKNQTNLASSQLVEQNVENAESTPSNNKRDQSIRFCKYSCHDSHLNDIEKERWVKICNEEEEGKSAENDAASSNSTTNRFKAISINDEVLHQQNAQIDEQSTLKPSQTQLFQQSITKLPKEFECGCKPQEIPFVKSDHLNILLVGKINDDECFPIFAKVIKQFKDKECRFLVEQHSLQKIKSEFSQGESELLGNTTIEEFKSKEHEMIIDLIVTLGGDGTILYSMSHFQHRASPPIIAIEKGTLGFMCMYQIQNIEADFTKILNSISSSGHLMVERKMRVHAIIKDAEGNDALQNGQKKEFHALNEIVVDRGINASCLRLELLLNGEELTKTLSDGLIFSTPTGSTAYSLSAGGPIIQNEVRSISLVPICPFSLSFRPIVLPECSQLKLAKDNRGQGKVSGDGQRTFDFLPGEELIVETSDIDVYVVREAYKVNNVHEWIIKIRKMLNWNSNFSK